MHPTEDLKPRLIILALSPDIAFVDRQFFRSLDEVAKPLIVTDTPARFRLNPDDVVRCSLLESSAVYRRVLLKEKCDPVDALFFSADIKILEAARDAGLNAFLLHASLRSVQPPVVNEAPGDRVPARQPSAEFRGTARCSAFYGKGFKQEGATSVDAIIADRFGADEPLRKWDRPATRVPKPRPN